MSVFLAQLLNGLQYGLLLFLIASGLTLIFGVLRVINLAHGSLFMMGAYAAFLVVRTSGSLWLALPAAILIGVGLGLLLERFLFRFFTISQFKRSAIPNSPKVGSGGSLSPRGDWRAPSDSEADAWLDELERNVPG